MKTLTKRQPRRASAKFTTPRPDMSYEAWQKETAKFREIMDGQAVDRRAASVIVREGRR